MKEFEITWTFDHCNEIRFVKATDVSNAHAIAFAEKYPRGGPIICRYGRITSIKEVTPKKHRYQVRYEFSSGDCQLDLVEAENMQEAAKLVESKRGLSQVTLIMKM